MSYKRDVNNKLIPLLYGSQKNKFSQSDALTTNFGCGLRLVGGRSLTRVCLEPISCREMPLVSISSLLLFC